MCCAIRRFNFLGRRVGLVVVEKRSGQMQDGWTRCPLDESKLMCCLGAPVRLVLVSCASTTADFEVEVLTVLLFSRALGT